jgi:hypothetical protein
MFQMITLAARPQNTVALGALAGALLVSACGGGGSDALSGPGPDVPPADTLIRVSGQSPFTPNCGGAQSGTLYFNAEVEPYVAVNPGSSANLIAVWQQDRWSNGGSQGHVTGVSFDGGLTWAMRTPPLSRCAGGNAANGGDYERTTDPWVTFSPNGVAYQMSLSFSGASFQPGSASAMLVSRSSDGGRTWADPATLIRDGAGFFNDKNSITADPDDARFVYAVWDRLAAGGGGPAYLARSVDGGSTWEAARPIYDPGIRSQTIGNQIVALPNGNLVDLFTQIDEGANSTTSAFLSVMRSADNGATWSQPSRIADLTALGASDPETGAAIRDGSIIGQIAADRSGNLYVVWQDARFSGGQRDGIALSRSSDGGVTWSAPLRINGDPAVQAFTPAVTVRSDGMIGVSYYDLRSNTFDPLTLPTDYWLARSRDAITWSESRAGGPFDLAIAPNAEGLFLGDYQALASVGALFIPVFVQTVDNANRSDVVARLVAVTDSSAAKHSAIWETVLAQEAKLPIHIATTASTLPMTVQFRQRVHENIVRNMERRVPGWSEIRSRRAAQPDR